MYKEKKRPLWMQMFLSVLGIIVFIGIWEAVVKFGLISEDKLVAPSQIVLTFMDKLENPIPDGNTIIVHFLTSLKLVVLGFLVSCIIGVPLGLFMGFFNVANRIFTPIFEIIRPIPPLAWIPIVIVVLDINGVINLARNNVLFFGVILSMFVSFQMINYFEKKKQK